MKTRKSPNATSIVEVILKLESGCRTFFVWSGNLRLMVNLLLGYPPINLVIIGKITLQTSKYLIPQRMFLLLDSVILITRAGIKSHKTGSMNYRFCLDLISQM